MSPPPAEESRRYEAVVAYQWSEGVKALIGTEEKLDRPVEESQPPLTTGFHLGSVGQKAGIHLLHLQTAAPFSATYCRSFTPVAAHTV